MRGPNVTTRKRTADDRSRRETSPRADDNLWFTERAVDRPAPTEFSSPGVVSAGCAESFVEAECADFRQVAELGQT
jgi:hypothetical protein